MIAVTYMTGTRDGDLLHIAGRPAGAWILIGLCVYLVAALIWWFVKPHLPRIVRWFWAAGASRPVGISTRSVQEIVGEYERGRYRKR